MSNSQYTRPSEADMYALARAIAKTAHSGQTRKGNGEPYFNHVARVAEYVREHNGLRAAIVAFLHDTVEDTTVTINTLRDLGFPARVVHDVTILTRGTDEKYMHYIGRLIEYGSDDALAVKLADLSDNLRDLDTLPFDTNELRERYIKASNWVLEEIERREISHEVDTVLLPAAA